MANKIYLSQRTNRQVVKRLNSSYVYEMNFGTYGTSKTDNTGLNFPWGIISDSFNNIYVCDSNNQRIVKLDNGLNYISSISLISSVGRPYAINFDQSSGDLYIAGIKNYRMYSIARMTTALNVVKFNDQLYPVLDTHQQPMGISADFTSGFFLISGMFDLLKVEETGSGFNSANPQIIISEENAHFLGHIKHSDGNLYLNAKRFRSSSIIRVLAGYINDGDSNLISPFSTYVSEGLNGNIFVYDNNNRKVLRYDSNLNFIEEVYSHSGTTIDLDALEITGILELDI